MLLMNISEPAQTQCISSVVFATEKERTLRFWVNQRKLNAIIVQDSYHFSRMDEFIDSLSAHKYFPH